MKKQLSLSLGVVKNNADPAEHGRLQIYIPAVDSTSFKTEDLPWASYVSPFGGTTANFKAGPESEEMPGITTYGFWAIPKNGAQVLVGFLEGDPLVRFWIGCFYMPEHNRTLPGGIEGTKTEIDESGVYGQHEIPFTKRNLKEAGLGPGTKHFRTRGGWQRSVSHPSNKNKNKPGDNGYAKKPTDPERQDSQIYSWTTPGRHFIVMSDVDDESRIRIKSAMGNQIILDDTNERIYISTARGNNYIEMDEANGKLHVHSSSKLNLHGMNDVNIYSDENINIVAKKRINIQSEERGVKIQSKMNFEVISQAGDVRLNASRDLTLKTLNGPKATAVAEKQTVNKPPYAGKPLGVIRDWAEAGGSATSKIKFDSHGTLVARSSGGSVEITAKNSVDLRALGGNVNLQSGGDVSIKGANLRTSVGTTGMYAEHDGPKEVKSLGNASGAVAAEGTTSSKSDVVKPKMIVPEHESWTRDEDEVIAPTPRNAKYQG